MTQNGGISSALLALVAWATNYFATDGQGGNLWYAPLVVLAIPLAIQIYKVVTTPTPPAEAAARGMGGSTPQRGKLSRIVLGD